MKKVYQIEEGADFNIAIRFIKLLLIRLISFSYDYESGTITAEGLNYHDIKHINAFLADNTQNTFHLISEKEA